MTTNNNQLLKNAQTHLREAALNLALLHRGCLRASESHARLSDRQQFIDAAETFHEHANVCNQSLAAITEAYPGWLPEANEHQAETVPAGAD